MPASYHAVDACPLARVIRQRIATILANDSASFSTGTERATTLVVLRRNWIPFKTVFVSTDDTLPFKAPHVVRRPKRTIGSLSRMLLALPLSYALCSQPARAGTEAETETETTAETPPSVTPEQSDRLAPLPTEGASSAPAKERARRDAATARVLWVERSPADEAAGRAPIPANAQPDPCDGNDPESSALETCRTRQGVVSGFYVAVDAGMARLSREPAERIGAGNGLTFAFRLGVELMDLVIIGMDFHFTRFTDNHPFSEEVVSCTTYEGKVVGCDAPYSADSDISGVAVAIETGLQHRFRPFAVSTWTPGLMLGYAAATVKRGVGCEGCRTEDVDAKLAGAYLAPFFRVTLGESAHWAVIARSAWFMTGDLKHVSTVGIEFGAP